jgi:peptide deformylase
MAKHQHAHPIDAHLPTTPNATISGTYRRVVVRRVLTHPNAVLARRSRDIDPRAPGIVALAEELVTTMRASAGCVGLAAPQIGESVRLFCVDVTGHRKTKSCAGLVVMVNPRIVERSEDVVMREGCLSVPDFTGDVARAASVVVEGFEPGSTKLVRIAANAMEARCLLHEIDHLDGILFTDRVVDHAKSLFPRKAYA